jgi:outer membrane protein assembly factor BamA
MPGIRFPVMLMFLLSFTGLDGISQSGNSICLSVTLPGYPAEELPARLKKLGLSPEKTVDLKEIQPLMESILRMYENSGYPFVKAELDTIRISGTSLKGFLRIETGERITIDSVMNRTGYRISQRLLYRITGIQPGDLYSESAIRSASLRLSGIDWLVQKKQPDIGFHGPYASLFLYPDKAASNRFDGWIGLTPASSSGGSLGFAGALDLNLQNVLGQGESWSVTWRRNQDRSQQLKLGFTIPWLAGLPFGIHTSLQMYRQDTSYLNLNLEAGVPYYFSPSNQLNLFYRVKQSNLLTEGNLTEAERNRSYQTRLTGLSWNWIRLDRTLSPTKGWQIHAEGSFGKKEVEGSAGISQSEINADVSTYLSVIKSVVFSLRLRGGALFSSQLLQNESFRFGGVQDLRGFDEDIFRTDRFILGSVELRYLLDSASYLLILADYGLLHPVAISDKAYKRPLGLGIGGQLKTSGGIFRIIFGLGKESNVPFSLQTGKIHIGYVGLF